MELRYLAFVLRLELVEMVECFLVRLAVTVKLGLAQLEFAQLELIVLGFN